jgi:hypothetical protein
MADISRLAQLDPSSPTFMVDYAQGVCDLVMGPVKIVRYRCRVCGEMADTKSGTFDDNGFDCKRCAREHAEKVANPPFAIEDSHLEAGRDEDRGIS